MNIIVPGLVILLVFSLAGAAGMRSHQARRWRAVSSSAIKSMSRDEVSRLLERIAGEKEPEFVMGAMCYAVMAMPEVAEYVCPVCGEKTVYGSEHAATIQWGLSTARSIVDAIRSSSELDVVLDESGFCSRCAPDSVEPGLRLVVTYEDGTTSVAGVTSDDLRMLAGVLSGELYYLTSNDSRSPLAPNIERMRSILGIEASPE